MRRMHALLVPAALLAGCGDGSPPGYELTGADAGNMQGTRFDSKADCDFAREQFVRALAWDGLRGKEPVEEESEDTNQAVTGPPDIHCVRK